MSNLLHPNQVIVSDLKGLTCRVQKYLGGGTQGEVYTATIGGRTAAIKWYFVENLPEDRESQFYNMQRLVKAGSPNPMFLWPIDLVTSPDVEGYGYIMPLREPRFKSVIDWMYRRVNPTFDSLLTAGYNMASGFYDLHAAGMCYRDINFGNIFIDFATGDVAICDNDNAAPDGSNSLVLGTPDFMAPEIVRGEAKPSTYSDLFSLAVLLFYTFYINHPLYGRKVLSVHSLDNASKHILCGTEPLFIFDPNDKSNEAVPMEEDKLGEAGANALKFWNVYPRFFRDMFTRSFTLGLKDPGARVRETEWKDAMITARNLLMHCPSCGVENFYDAEKVHADLSGMVPEGQPCWHCGAVIKTPARIRLTTQANARSLVVLEEGKKLFPHHTDDRAYDFSAPSAVVVKHPQTGALGLANANGSSWNASLGEKKAEISPGKIAPLATGLQIDFGKIKAEVKL